MSIPGIPQGRGEIGETIASFPTYEAAQKSVSTLIAGEIPARDMAIVGYGLRSIERVTGRLGYATAARSGAINGLLLGLFFSAIFVLGSPSVQISAFIGVMFLGIAIGMLLSIVTYTLVRRRRDYASVMQVVADHYDVTVLPSSIHRARQLVGPQSPTLRTVVARPEPIVPPQPRPHPVPTPQPSPSPEPPRYGERRPTPGESPVSEPVDNPTEPQEPAHETPEAQPEEPPRYGERRPEPPLA